MDEEGKEILILYTEIDSYVNDPGFVDALNFYLTTRDLETQPWRGCWPSWPYRAMRFFLALKREEVKVNYEEERDRASSAS